MRRVVITGMGVVSPLGNTIDTFWQGLISGHSGVKSLKEIVHSDLFERITSDFASQVIAEVEESDVAQLLPDLFRQRDRYVQFAAAAALQAVHDADLDAPSAAIRDNWGISFTTAVGAAHTTENTYCQATLKGTDEVDPARLPSDFYIDLISNTPAILLAQFLGLHGPCDTLSSACASGVDAIGYAYESIRDGEANTMLAIASEAPLSPTRFGGCDIIHCLASQYNDQPQRASRPFDKNRNGFVLGEGGGAFVLEEYEQAIARGAHIYAEVAGFGLTNNATHMISLKPTVSPHLARAITLALDDANVLPEAIHYINPHASSTNQNDQTETKAIKEALGEHAYHVPMSSTKSEIGHSLGSASMFGSIAAILTLTRGIIHPTINYEEPDPLCDLDCVPNEARPFSGTGALVIANGFSGIHSALVLQKLER